MLAGALLNVVTVGGRLADSDEALAAVLRADPVAAVWSRNELPLLIPLVSATPDLHIGAVRSRHARDVETSVRRVLRLQLIDPCREWLRSRAEGCFAEFVAGL